MKIYFETWIYGEVRSYKKKENKKKRERKRGIYVREKLC